MRHRQDVTGACDKLMRLARCKISAVPGDVGGCGGGVGVSDVAGA